MAQTGGISGVAVGMATAGAFLLYIGIQGVSIRDGLKSITSGTLPTGPGRTAAAVADAEARLQQGTAGGTSGGGGTVGSGANPAVAKAALAYKGVPYRLGGTTRQGLDCSGLVVRAFQDAYGVTPPRTTYVQVVWKQLRKIPTDQVAAGDLCFFPAVGPPSHVAIALDGDQVVHAPRPGKVVEVVPLKNAFTAGAKPSVFRYVGGRG